MKKIKSIIPAIVLTAMLSGCSQEIKVTVYNATGVTSDNGWIAMNADTGSHNEWFEATSAAYSEADVDETNSFSFTAKENDTLTVQANGQYYTVASGGGVTTTDFDIPSSTQVLYGEFLGDPQWFASVNMESVVIFKK
ncbi:MAG: lipoprotein [Spirochaetia bacterium]|nr:lipoprotein [Spirochaetia bacterium]